MSFTYLIGVFSTTAKYVVESINKRLTLICVIMFLLMISFENFAVPLNTPLYLGFVQRQMMRIEKQ